MPDALTLEQWILQMGIGDMAAFRMVYDACAQGLYAYALAILKRPQPAEDAVQDGFLRIWRAAPGYRADGKPLAWMLRIVRNLCMDQLRRNRELPTEEDPLASSSVDEDYTDAVIDRIDLVRLMHRVLTQEERQIVALRIYNDLPHNQIAQVLGCTAQTIRWKYNYALRKLRRALEASHISPQKEADTL